MSIFKNKKEKIGKSLDNVIKEVDTVLEDAQYAIYKKDFNKAEGILGSIVNKVENLGAFQDNQVSEYRRFNEYFEYLLYVIFYKPEREIQTPSIPYPKIYLLYGYVLFELGKLVEARNALRKGLHWNPVNFKMLAEYAETFKQLNELDEFLSITKYCIKIAFYPQDIARCYRNLGYYFIERQLYSEAIGCYKMSLYFTEDTEDINKAQSELYIINLLTEGTVKQPTFEQYTDYAKKYDFPVNASVDMTNFAVSFATKFVEKRGFYQAKYCLSIAANICLNEELKKSILDSINEINMLTCKE